MMRDPEAPSTAEPHAREYRHLLGILNERERDAQLILGLIAKIARRDKELILSDQALEQQILGSDDAARAWWIRLQSLIEENCSHMLVDDIVATLRQFATDRMRADRDPLRKALDESAM